MVPNLIKFAINSHLTWLYRESQDHCIFWHETSQFSPNCFKIMINNSEPLFFIPPTTIGCYVLHTSSLLNYTTRYGQLGQNQQWYNNICYILSQIWDNPNLYYLGYLTGWLSCIKGTNEPLYWKNSTLWKLVHSSYINIMICMCMVRWHCHTCSCFFPACTKDIWCSLYFAFAFSLLR